MRMFAAQFAAIFSSAFKVSAAIARASPVRGMKEKTLLFLVSFRSSL